MDFAGIVPADAPDPQDAVHARLRDAPMPVWGFIPQPALEGHVDVGIGTATDDRGVYEVSASLGYPLWRNPADHADPVNLAVLDDRTRTALDEVPPWPRPPWLVEGVERMRYARLWEAVRTTWHREQNERTTLAHELIEHTRYILANQFREQLGLGFGPGMWDEPGLRISPAAVDSAVTVTVDGATMAGAVIDTDPFVYAIGFRATADTVVTAVVAREEISHVSIEFRCWQPEVVVDA